MSFLLSTIKTLAGSNLVPEENKNAAAVAPVVAATKTTEEPKNEADSGGIKLPSPCGTVTRMGIPDAESDFNQWLHAMKMVARLPGGMPPDFRRKLWLALSDRYLQNKGVNWKAEEEKCFSETWGADDQELGIQIVKDLHRTGSSLCSGPAGTINQAKLKRILLGYARWNPEVGYCQGFNMLGALILQVMDKNESDAIKVMIFLIEGLIPSGYFHGALGGLQADMAVFRELLGTKVPKLARHLQKLQGPQDERALEPPLTNVFTMQWFLTLFCNCLPINCVLRVWDLILIEGSDVLLRTALAIWSLLEDKILLAKTADDFYCKMGSLSGELLTGTLIDSNGLVQRIVDLGPIQDLDRMRERHRQTIPSLKQKKGLKVFYSDDDLESDEESKMAVATVWGGLRGQNRRNSQPNVRAQNNVDTKQTIALDINILKKQYNKLRERQKQAHVILSSAVARQPSNPNPVPAATTSSQGNQINNLLAGKSAIISNKRRLGPPPGAVPLARNIKQSKPIKVPGNSVGSSKQTSLNWKDIKQDENTKQREVQGKKRHDSSSYSEDSDSSTSTSLCDDDPPGLSCSSVEGSPLKKDLFQVPVENRVENLEKRIADLTEDFEGAKERKMQEFDALLDIAATDKNLTTDNNDNKDINNYKDIEYERIKDDELDVELAGSFSPLEEFSPINEAPKFLSISPISPFRTPSPILDYSSFIKSLQSKSSPTPSSSSPPPSITTITTTTTFPHETSSTALAIVNTNNQIISDVSDNKQFIVTDEGVTNALFERINSADPRLKSPSTVLELPIGVTSLPDASIIPACADMAAIPADRSPLINKNNIFNLDDTKIVEAAPSQPPPPIAAVEPTPPPVTTTVRRESADITAFMEENNKMLSRITTRKPDPEAVPVEPSPSVVTEPKPEIKPSLVKNEEKEHPNPKTPKLTKRVTFSEEDNKVELIEARTPTEDDDVHVMRLRPGDVETVPEEHEHEVDEKSNKDNGHYFFDTMDEIVQEQEQRKLKLQCTEIPEEEKIKMESELIHEEQLIVEKQGKFNEISGTCVREKIEDPKLEDVSTIQKSPERKPVIRKNDEDLVDGRKSAEKTYEDELLSRKSTKTFEETRKADERIYKRDLSPDPKRIEISQKSDGIIYKRELSPEPKAFETSRKSEDRVYKRDLSPRTFNEARKSDERVFKRDLSPDPKTFEETRKSNERISRRDLSPDSRIFDESRQNERISRRDLSPDTRVFEANRKSDERISDERISEENRKLDEMMSRRDLSPDPKSFEKSIYSDSRSYRRELSPDPISSYKKDEFNKEYSSSRDLPSSDMTSSFPRTSRKIADYHMSSFDEMTLEIRKEMHNLKSERAYNELKYNEQLEYEQKYKRPENFKKSHDISVDQLSTDTLRSLLNETKVELYGGEKRSPIRSPVKIAVDFVREDEKTKKIDDGIISSYQRSPIKNSHDPSPIEDKFVLKDNSDLLRNSVKNREFAEQFELKHAKNERSVSPARNLSSRENSPSRKTISSREASPSRRTLSSREASPSRRMLSSREASPSRKPSPSRKASPERLDLSDQSSLYRNAAKNRQFVNQLDIDESKVEKLSPRAELHAILTKPSIKESMDFSYFDDIREPSFNESNRSIKLFSTNEELKTPSLRDPTNIKDKISSISKTINSINSLCRGETKYELTYRTLERYCDKKDVHSVRKEMDQNRLDKVLDDIMIKSAAPTPIVRVSEPDDLQMRRELSPRSTSRSRESSPRKIFAAEDEFEVRVSRHMSNLRYITTKGNFDKLDRYMFKKESEFALAGLPYNTHKRTPEMLYTRSTSPLEKSSKKYPDDLDIRHSTVTSTFYDRYMYQKQGRLDKSPSSPTINRAYLDTLKPGGYRVTRSAETSPMRGNFRTDNLHLTSSRSSPMKESKYGALLKRADNAIKSCEDIPRQIKEAGILDKSKQRSHQDLHSTSNYN